MRKTWAYKQAVKVFIFLCERNQTNQRVDPSNVPKNLTLKKDICI